MGKENCRIKYNWIWIVASAVILWSVLGLCFTYYYDLNDDILIKDIISGIYTGNPDAHNNQMMYPISLMLTGLYSIWPEVAWFGLMEIGLFILSYILVGYRMLGMLRGWISKCLFTLTYMAVWSGLYLWELTMLQYTVVAGILCATASVWLYTSDKRYFEISTSDEASVEDTDSVKRYVLGFLGENAIAIILVILAFNIRSEMMLLMCPFMAAAGLFRWSEEETGERGIKGYISVKLCARYLSVIGCILLGIIATVVIDTAAYSSTEWKEFRRLFDARTDVYDFTGIPDYKANEEFYNSIDISEHEYGLLERYDYGIDESIDAPVLEAVATYVKNNPDCGAKGASRSLRRAVSAYIKDAIQIGSVHTTPDVISPFASEVNQLEPMSMIVLIIYILCLAIAIHRKSGCIAFKLVILGLLRSICWIYIYYMGRLVPRITHPMLMTEILILTAVILTECRRSLDTGINVFKDGNSPYSITVVMGIFAIVLMAFSAVFNISDQVNVVRRSQEIREEKNRTAREFVQYADVFNDYYIVDVYSTVDWTEKVFDPYETGGIKGAKVSKKNWQLAGGWMAGSPLDKHKRDMAYEDNHNLLFVSEEDDIGWLAEYYSYTMGRYVTVSVNDVVGKSGQRLYLYIINGIR